MRSWALAISAATAGSIAINLMVDHPWWRQTLAGVLLGAAMILWSLWVKTWTEERRKR